MSSTRKAQWQIHFCVLLWGFTAILGKLITLPALSLVWWRMLLVSLALLAVPRVWRGLAALTRPLFASYAGVGILVALHWLTFYGAIKLSNASVAVTCIALGPVFLALVEPWISGRRFNPGELLLGIAVVPGVALVVGGVPSGMHWGIVIGVVSALLVAIFGALNKHLVERADALTVTFGNWVQARFSSARSGRSYGYLACSMAMHRCSRQVRATPPSCCCSRWLAPCCPLSCRWSPCAS